MEQKISFPLQEEVRDGGYCKEEIVGFMEANYFKLMDYFSRSVENQVHLSV